MNDSPPDVHTMAVAAARRARAHGDHPYTVHLAGQATVLTAVFPGGGPGWPLAVAGHFGPLLGCLSVTLVAEGYTLEAAPGTEAPSIGDLQAFFGVDPDIVECVQVSTVWRDGRTKATTLPYQRPTPDSRQVRWLPAYDGDLHGGAVADALNEAGTGPPAAGYTLPGREIERYVACARWAASEAGCAASVAHLEDLEQAHLDNGAPPGTYN